MTTYALTATDRDMAPCSARGAVLLLLCAAVNALDNGFSKPALGWSSWYAAPYGSQVTDAFVRASTNALIKSGLAAKGYARANRPKRHHWPLATETELATAGERLP